MQRHNFMHVVTVFDVEDPNAKWEWCRRCGTLSCNRAEFHLPGKKELVSQDPGCVPLVSVDAMRKFDEAMKKISEYGVTLRTSPVLRKKRPTS